ncbi:MAG: protein phosphatase 2C domain-containing protein [Clostridia bacterium]|nr:protein phosphatase 2C domain-containing protein [Clostridia bacterium]
MWKINKSFLQGQLHNAQRRRCEDYATSYQTADITAIAVADGAGSLSDSADGAMTAAKTASRYIADNFEKIYSSQNPEKEKFFIIEAIKYEIEKSYGREDFENFGSTLLCVAVKDNRYIAVHLGDGVIGSANADKTAKTVFSAPMNGLTKNQTYLTGMKNVFRYLRVYTGLTDDISEFVIFTDGIADVFVSENDNSMLYDTDKLLSNKCNDYMNEKYDGYDDYSFAIMVKL